MLEARGSTLVKGRKADAPELLPMSKPDYPANLHHEARPYFDGICANLEAIKRLRDVYAPGITLLANLMAEHDRICASELEPRSEELTPMEVALIESRVGIRKKTLVDQIIKLMDRHYMHPASMEGVSIPKDPAKQVETNGKAPLRRSK